MSGYIYCGSSIKIRPIGTTEMDELAFGDEFTDFFSLSAAVAQFENSNFVQFYKRDSRTVEEDVYVCRYIVCLRNSNKITFCFGLQIMSYLFKKIDK